MKAAALTAVSRSRSKENASEKSEIYHLSVVGISFRGLVTGEPQQDHPRMEEKKRGIGKRGLSPILHPYNEQFARGNCYRLVAAVNLYCPIERVRAKGGRRRGNRKIARLTRENSRALRCINIFFTTIISSRASIPAF